VRTVAESAEAVDLAAILIPQPDPDTRPEPGVRVLLLDEDRTIARSFPPLANGSRLEARHDQASGLSRLKEGSWDLVVLDLDFSGCGLDLLRRIRSEDGAPPVLLIAARPTMEVMVQGIEAGALDVLPKPLPADRFGPILRSLGSAGAVRPLPEPDCDDSTIIGSSGPMLAVFKALARAAASSATVLLLGESGTGKEMVARVLHQRSRRRAGPFVTINCAAIPEHLLESELFGHEKGAFTGAFARRIGRFERASGGTLFLDEIGDMSLALQAKILRALQEREIERVGGQAPVPIDVRVLAATNLDLERAVAAHQFREDLFYRLAVITMRLPTLRERGRDLEMLAEHFAARYAAEHGRPIRAMEEAVFEELARRSWPGNVRQLRNVMERAVVMASGDTLSVEHLPPGESEGAEAGDEGVPLLSLEEMERRLILRALRETDGQISGAAGILGIHRNTLRRKMQQHDIPS
jgi:two-component system, NtrC family, response regulator HydG